MTRLLLSDAKQAHDLLTTKNTKITKDTIAVIQLRTSRFAWPPQAARGANFVTLWLNRLRDQFVFAGSGVDTVTARPALPSSTGMIVLTNISPAMT